MRRRRVRLFETLFVILLIPVFITTALVWQDVSVTPDLHLDYVSYASAGNVTISGLVARPAGAVGDLPGVLIVHDYGGKKEDMHRLTLEFARHGFVAMAIDLRGHGMSTGASQFMAPGAEVEDVRWGVSFLRGMDGVDGGHLAMVGYGLGGTAVLQAAATPDAQVNATVVWAATVDFVALSEERPQTLLDLAGRRALDPSVLDTAQLLERSPSLTLGDVRPNSTLFVAGGSDPWIPPDQAQTGAVLAPGGQVALYPALDHRLAGLEVDEQTISFVEQRTKGQTSAPLEPVYPYVERDRLILGQSMTALALPVAWLAWERWCTRSPTRVRLYNYPGDRNRVRAAAFLAADLGAFGAVVLAAGLVAQPGPQGVLAGIAPSPTSFAALAVAAVALAVGGFGLADLERRLRGRDEARFEEAETLRRSLLVGLSVVPVLLAATFLPSVVAQGAPWPASAGFLLAFAVFFVFTLGFEAFLRLRIERRLRGVVSSLFGTTGLRASAGSVAVGTLLYFAMMSAAVASLFGGWPSGALPTALAITMAVGLLSSVLFDRTRNVLAGAFYSALWITWVANSALRF